MKTLPDDTVFSMYENRYSVSKNQYVLVEKWVENSLEYPLSPTIGESYRAVYDNYTDFIRNNVQDDDQQKNALLGKRKFLQVFLEQVNLTKRNVGLVQKRPLKIVGAALKR